MDSAVPDAACNMTESVRSSRQRWVHPSVWLATLPVAAMFVFLNWHGDRISSIGGLYTHEHGWPQTFLHRIGGDASAWQLTKDIQADHVFWPAFDKRALLIDVATAVLGLGAFIAVSELRRRRRGSLLRFSAFDLLVGVTVVAVGLGWWTSQTRQRQQEEAQIALLNEHAFTVHEAVTGPAWLSRICGHERLPMAAATSLKWPDGADDNTAATFSREVGQLRLLDRMSFFGTNVSDRGLEAALRSRSVRRLTLGHAMTGRGLVALHDCCLEELNASDTRFDDAGMAELSRQRGLMALDVSSTPVTDNGLHALERLQHLRDLNLSKTLVTDRGLESLKNARDLISLEVMNTSVTGRSLSVLPEASLKELLADDSLFDDAGMVVLARQGNLVRVSLRNTAVTDDGIRHLAGMRYLRALDFRGTFITDEAADTLATMERLEWLGVPQPPQFSSQTLERLRTRLPNAKVDAG
jgi:hypothetical protein